ncbi:MAG: IS3 family transposase [Rhodopirellula sp.]|nr:IS3 family transposase [Rhodopirellula sp.]
MTKQAAESGGRRDHTASRCSVFQYIETFYNSKRIHQTRGDQTPNEFEEQHRTRLAG